MKREKAIEIMLQAGIHNVAEVYWDTSPDDEVIDLEFQGAEGVERILEMMDKDTAKKPVLRNGRLYVYDCQACGDYVINEYEDEVERYSFCKSCGQRIDWDGILEKKVEGN